jgi:hypothetical protein
MESSLHAVERGVAPCSPDQVIMAAIFDDASAFNRNDAVGTSDGREAVRDHKHSAALRDTRHIVLDNSFTLVVERRRCLVEDENARVSDQRSRNRNTLALPTR